MDGRPIQLRFRVQGLDCAEEVAMLRRVVGPVVGGGERLGFDVLRGVMTVDGADERLTATIVAAVASTGMRAELSPPDGDRLPVSRRPVQRQAVLTAISGACGIVACLLHAQAAESWLAALGSEGVGLAQDPPLAAEMFYIAGILAGGWRVLPKAWYALRQRRPDMNLLMTVAVIGAVGIGEWFEAATVTFLFAVSLLLESWSIGRARHAIEALLDLTPPTARVRRRDGGEELVPPASVDRGTQFAVMPGERFPLDGRVVEGTSHVNQGPITGESQPVLKSPGDDVFAGTINGDGALLIECTRSAQESVLAHTIRLVEQAQSRRAPSEQWVDKFARFYTPSVMAVALLVLLAPPLAFGAAWSTWFYNALVLLVIACPCALVISTPVSVVAALASAARQGVLIKGGAFVEAPTKLRAIAFDKTGTLTVGRPTVVEIVPLSGHDERELLERAAAVEARSNHPLAHAIVAYARQRGVSPKPAEDVQVLQGQGATAQFDGRPFWLGSHRYLEQRGQETPEILKRLAQLSTAGRTVVVVGNESHVCGLIALADTVRPQVRDVIGELRALGVGRCVMLTGDNRPTAEAIAEATGVDEVRAELLPADKVTAVESLVARFGEVAMVGDGVNDAPALARATVGIAMGAVGSDAAIETADIALMSDDLTRLPWLIRHARRTVATIRQNIAFALAVKAAVVALTFLGYASLWAAIAADMGASLLVVGNGLRLLRSR